MLQGMMITLCTSLWWPWLFPTSSPSSWWSTPWSTHGGTVPRLKMMSIDPESEPSLGSPPPSLPAIHQAWTLEHFSQIKFFLFFHFHFRNLMTNSYSTPSPKGFLFGQFLTNLARTANGNMRIIGHIWQNAQVTSNKMVHKKGHNFLAQFSIPFHTAWSVLLWVVAQKNHLLTG